MMFRSSSVTVLAIVAVGALLALLALPDSKRDAGIEIDRHTGRAMLTPEDHLRHARGFGDASKALSHLRSVLAAGQLTPEIRSVLAVLRHELESPPNWTDPRTTVPSEPAALVTWLARRDGDAEQSAALDRLFLGSLAADAIDADAARLLVALREGRRVPSAAALDLARRFELSGRERAQLRWLRHAWHIAPSNPRNALALANALVAGGGLRAAHTVLDRAVPDASSLVEVERLRMQLSSWLEEPEQSAEAGERLLAGAGDALTPAERRELHERLRRLWTELSRLERALPHALAAVTVREDSTDEVQPSDLAAAADLALQVGDHDLGFDLLARRLERLERDGPNDRAVEARRDLATLAVEDLRIDLACELLRPLAANDPLGPDADRLLQILAKCGRTDEQSELLAARLRTLDDLPGPYGAADDLRRRLIHRAVAAGADRTAAGMLRALAHREGELAPARYLSWLAWFESAEISDLDSRLANLVERIADPARDDSDRVADETRIVLTAISERPGAWPETLVALEHGFLNDRSGATRAALRDDVRTVLVTACDRSTDPRQAAARLGALAARHPTDSVLLTAAAERAAWQGDRPAELRVRLQLWHLEPTNIENAKRLARLHAANSEPRKAAALERALAAQLPQPIPALRRAAMDLLSAGDEPAAIEQLEAGLGQPGTLDDRLGLGDDLLALGARDGARSAYQAALTDDPEHPHALLRLGLLASWSDSPELAVELLTRRLDATTADAGRVQFHLAEALMAAGRPRSAEARYARAASALRTTPNRTHAEDLMLARAWARSGEPARAELLLWTLVPTAESLWTGKTATNPHELDRVLALIEALLAGSRMGLAATWTERALRVAPDDERVQSLATSVFEARGELDRATTVLDASLDLDAAREAPVDPAADARKHALATTFEEAQGSYRSALDHADRWLGLDPGPDAAMRTARLADRVANHAIVRGSLRSVGDDRTLVLQTAGSLVLDSGPEDEAAVRLDLAIGHASYRGITLAPDGSLGPRLETDTARLDLAASWRIDGPRQLLGAGLSAFPGADGSGGLGGFVAWHDEGTSDSGQYTSFEVRAGVSELWTDPAAAPALGGRQDSLAVTYYRELGTLTARGDGGSNGARGEPTTLFGGVDIELRRLGARIPGAGNPTTAGSREHDGRIDAQVTFGARLLGRRAAVADLYRLRNTPSIPNSPYLAGDGPDPETRLLTWVGWQSIRQLDDAELASVLPIGKRFDYAVWAVRADRQLLPNLGGAVSGFAGYEFRADTPSFGIEMASTWRPNRTVEATLRAGYGSAIGRAGTDEESYLLVLEGVLRW